MVPFLAENHQPGFPTTPPNYMFLPGDVDVRRVVKQVQRQLQHALRQGGINLERTTEQAIPSTDLHRIQ